MRQADGLVLVVPIHPDEGSVPVENALAATATDEVALVCVHEVTAESLKWAHELATWRWIRDNCEELRVDDLARAEVSERLASAEAALIEAGPEAGRVGKECVRTCSFRWSPDN